MELLKALLKAILLVGIATLLTGIIVLLVHISPILCICFVFVIIMIALTIMFYVTQ